MKNSIVQAFKEKFQHDPILIQAPGRINLIGEHTDYNQGFVFPAAIDKYIWLAMGKGPGSLVEVQAWNLQEELVFNLKEADPAGREGWKAYIHAVLTILTEKGYPIGGIQVVFGGNIPIGAGLSSSAALCCGLIHGISKLYNLEIPRPENALLAQAAEHRIGLNCGLMDQYAVLFGKENQPFCLDCQHLTFNYYSLHTGAFALVLINSKIKHELAADSGYNDRRASCERVVHTLAQEYSQINSLRDVDMSKLETWKDQLEPTDFKRASFVIAENERVQHMIQALQNEDLKRAGQLLYASHEGLQFEYEVTVPEIDFLIDLTKNEPDVLGARQVGGGFGGCTLNLIKSTAKGPILNRIKKAYFQKTSIEPEVIEFKLGNGVDVMSDELV